MEPVLPTVATLLDVARDFVSQRDPDIEELLILLANMPLDELDVQTRGAVQHARMVATSAQGRKIGPSAVPRFALARLHVWREQHEAMSRSPQPDQQPGSSDIA